jgi:hypothetical protein
VALDDLDLVLLHEAADAACHGLDHLVTPLAGDREVE